MKKLRRTTPFLIFTFLFWASTWAQDNTQIFKRISVEDGLSQSSVINIIQDSLGFLWFGTRDGLNRYEGNRFVIFRHDLTDKNSISNNFIHCLHVDQSGNIWVGTESGLNKYNFETEGFTTIINPIDSTDIDANFIQAIGEKEGIIYVGTSRGLWIYNPASGTSSSLLHHPDDPNSLSSNLIYTVLVCRNGDVAIGTDNGLNLLKEQDGKYVVFKKFLNEQNNRKSFRRNDIRAIVEGKHGNIWLGTYSGGLMNLDPVVGTIKEYLHDPLNPQSISDNRIHSLAIDHEGLLWVGTNNGLNILQEKEHSFVRYYNNSIKTSLSQNSVKSIFIDRKGSKWIGTYYGGVNLLDDDLNLFTSYQAEKSTVGLSSNIVNGFLEDSLGNWWVGTDNGISIFEPETSKFQQANDLGWQNWQEGITIKSMLQGKNEKIWLGTYNHGLVIFDEQKQSAEWIQSDPDNPNSLSNNNVYSLLQEDDNTIWMGMHDGGLIRYEVDKHLFHSYQPSNAPGSLSSKSVRNLFLDSKQRLWIGTENGGLNLFLPEENQFKRYTNNPNQKGSISSNAVNTINEDSQGHLWIGTGHGLNFFDPTSNVFIAFTDKDELPSNTIVGVLEDEKGNIWISTNNGLAKLRFEFDSQDLPKLVAVNSYDQWDGLPGNEFNYNAYYKTRTGNLLFGGFNGFVTVNPSEMKPNYFVPPLVFTGFKVLNKKIKAGDGTGFLEKNINEPQIITLPYNQATFTIEFSILNYINPEKNIYKYKLDGLENDWNYTNNQTSVSYTVQNAGAYTFHIQGANNDGVWNESIRTLKIKILPPPWKSWWAYLLYGSLIMLAFFSVMHFTKVRSQLKYELHIEQLEKERQEELHQMKLQFFTNITHEFRTPLTLIMGPLEQILKTHGNNEALKHQLLGINKNVDRLLRLINQLLTFRKLETNHLRLSCEEVDLVAFLKEINLSFEEHANFRDIQFDLHTTEERILVYVDPEKLERVFFNLLSNAFKFTEDKGRVRMEIVRIKEGTDHRVEVLITDNGHGISAEDLPHIFERFYEKHSFSNNLIKGTGIGLALSKQIIELHHGIIKVQSELGKGAKFTVQLPMGSASLQREDQPEKGKTKESLLALSEQISQPKTPNLPAELPAYRYVFFPKKPKVLIVEDNKEVRDYLKSIFQKHFIIFEAENGRIGLEEAIKSTPDLVVSDVMMPEVDGIDLCRRIKSEIRTSHIPVILLTARASSIYKLDGLDSGADDYITKPFQSDELLLKARNIINSRKVLREKFSKKYNLEPSEITVTSTDEKFLINALDVVEKHIKNPLFDTNKFASEMAVSRSVLFEKIKVLTNETPNNFVKTIRLKRAAQLLAQKKFEVAEVCYQVGFKDKKYFSKCFAKMYGQVPSEFIRNQLPSEESPPS